MMFLVRNTLIVQSESREPILKTNSTTILIFIISILMISLFLFSNFFFKSTYLLRSFGELSVDPEIAFRNNKPTFLEFYAEWCEVCNEMAPQVSSLRDDYKKDINFVFLNVDNQKWGNYIQKFAVNGIPQVNLFDKKGNLISTFIGKQDEIKIRESINNLQIEDKPYEEIFNTEFSEIQENKNNDVSPRSHG
jgi:thiol-disulfide isomerase/thioredoxin